MKAYFFYGSVICITCLLTVLIFLDFRQQRKAADTFQYTVRNTPLIVRHLLVAPERLKVKDWQIGETSVYCLKTNRDSRQISFQVAARDAIESKQFWLKTDGFIQFNDVEFEFWRLLDETNLRLGSEKRGFFFVQGAVPTPVPRLQVPANPIVLEKLGDEVLVTPIGLLKCVHYLTYIRSPDGELEPLLELWANPIARPLGLVRARWKDASLDSVEINTEAIPKIPQILLAEFSRNTSQDGTCVGCHTKNIGGKDLKMESSVRISGEILNVTQALFHYQQAEMVKPGDLIKIKLTKNKGRAWKEAAVRFSWKKGSFWVKPDRTIGIMFSLDAIAHDSNITVQPRNNRFVLHLDQ
ncbi:MAG: hypothetical protein F4039_01475 [Gammaproteobacteria bacterium]|nr:hypothetical protein [Candidatus Poribacteria bacterium]MYG05691.1 hypothetical protein [Candidatus Poribacteria bacterium]MYK42745.1 hypothetical protein [Gammaproteobacteria bacterium]